MIDGVVIIYSNAFLYEFADSVENSFVLCIASLLALVCILFSLAYLCCFGVPGDVAVSASCFINLMNESTASSSLWDDFNRIRRLIFLLSPSLKISQFRNLSVSLGTGCLREMVSLRVRMRAE